MKKLLLIPLVTLLSYVGFASFVYASNMPTQTNQRKKEIVLDRGNQYSDSLESAIQAIREKVASQSIDSENIGSKVVSGNSLRHITATNQSSKKTNDELYIEDVYVVSKIEGDKLASSKPKYPTIDDKTNLYLVLKAKEKGKTIYFSEISDFVLDSKKIHNSKISKWDTKKHGDLSVGWFKVEPAQRCLDNTNNGWHWEKVKYKETPFKKDAWVIEADVDPTFLVPQKGKGTMRFKAKISYNSKMVSSPGAESYGKTGIKENVPRISVRGNTGIPIVDWGYSFMNQPYIWGSESPTGKDENHQSERYIGADCADLVVAAARKAGHKIKYGGSHNLSPNDARRDTEFISREPVLYTDGVYRKNGKPVKINQENVKIGDIVLYNRHVGILTKDLSPVGILSSKDLVLHTLFKEPMEEPISQAYSPKFSIVRFNK